jgi:hypothetical protein
MRHVWYTRPVSDEGDISNETDVNKVIDDHVEEKIGAPDINTSRSDETVNDDDDTEQEKSRAIPSWIHDPVYGDKVSELYLDG